MNKTNNESLVVSGKESTSTFVFLGDSHAPFRPSPDHERAIRERAELRAILAPLLERDNGRPRFGVDSCVFCEAIIIEDESDYHLPTCPVLRRDELLGRA